MSEIDVRIGVVLLLLGAVCAGPAVAMPIDWDRAFPLLGSSPGAAPHLLVGFDLQPVPPGHPTGLDLQDPLAPVLAIAGQSNPQTFTTYLAVELPGLQPGTSIVYPVLTGSDVSTVRLEVQDSAGSRVLDLALDFSTSSGGKLSGPSAMPFTPPPPPTPFRRNGIFALSWRYTDLSDAYLTIRVFDAQGNPVRFRAIPEPASGALLGLGLVGAGVILRRRRRAR